MNFELRKNDRVKCKVIKHIPEESTFEIEEVVFKTKGYIITKNNYEKTILTQALKENYSITLYFDRKEKGKYFFSYQQISNETGISSLFSSDDNEFNKSLFEALFCSLGNYINP